MPSQFETPLSGSRTAAGASTTPRLARPSRLTWLLLALVLAGLLPTLGIGAFATWQAATGTRQAAEQRLLDRARALSLALDREVGAHRAAMATVATAAPLDGPAPDLAGFERLARRVHAAIGTPLILVDGRTLRPLLHTALPPGAPPPGLAAIAHRTVVEAGRLPLAHPSAPAPEPAASAPAPEPAAGDAAPDAGDPAPEPAIGLAVPVERDGEVPFLLLARLEPARLQALLAARNLPAGAEAMVVDRRGPPPARAGEGHPAAPAQPAAEESPQDSAGRREGILRAAGPDGVQRVVAWRMLDAAPGWEVAVSEPAPALDAGWRAPLHLVAAGGALALGLGLGLALLAARRILRPVARLEAHALALAGGAAPEPPAPAPVAELEALRRAIARAAAAVRAREAALAAAAARHRAVLDTAAEGILVACGEGRIVSANPAALRLFGYAGAEQELAGRPLAVLMPPDGRAPPPAGPVPDRAAGEAEAAGTGVLTLTGRRRDGSEFPAELSLAAFETAEGRFVTGMVRDVTCRVVAEQALRRQAERQALLLGLSRAILEERPDEPGLAALVFERLAPVLGADLLFSFALSPGGATMRLVAAPGVPAEHLPALRELPVGAGFCGQVVATGKAIAADAACIAGTEAGAFLRMLGATAYVGHPLVGSDGRPLGTLAFASTRRDGFDPDDLDLLQTLSGFVALAWQQRRAEAGLRDKEAFLSSVLDASTDCVKVIEPDGRLTFMNATGRCLMEIDDFGLVEGRDWASLWPEAGRLQVRAAVAAALAGRETRFDGFCPTAKGAPRWWDVAVAPVRDAQGRVVRLVSASRDVTGRKATEEELARLAERVAIAQLAAKAAAYEFRPATGEVFRNEALQPLLGYALDELEPTVAGWRALIHPDDRARFDATLQATARRGGDYAMEYRVRHKAGPYVWLADTARVVRGPDGQVERVVGLSADITERKATETALAESESRLRLALEAGRMGIWDWDLGTDRLDWDLRQFELFGLDPAAGPPAGEAALARVHPADRPGLEAAIRGALDSTDGAYSAEFRVLLDGGAVRWLGAHGHALRGADGAPRRMVGINYDITDRKEAEAVLAGSREELERLVEQRTAALRQSEARLAEAARLEALGRLAGGIAHDVNNVLQAIQGGVSLARKRLGRDPEGAARFLDLASESVERGTAVTGRLLSFARRGGLQASAVPTGAMLEGLAELLRHTLGPAVRVTAEAGADTPELLADLGQLEAVLVNLANNARDALPSSGGRVTLRAAAAPAPHLPPGDYVRISVEDDGAGMTPEVLARVTEPFFTTKPKGKGTGLGLAMARGFAEQSGGGLTIESAPGRGTTVSLWLPRAAAGAGPRGADGRDAPPAAPPLGTVSLLVVDDEPMVRMTLAAELSERGHAVAEAEDGAAALGRLEAGGAVQALVTDLSMPGGMDGLALIREARRRRPGLPAVLVTGHVGDAARSALEEAAGAGPFAVLRKPVTAEAVEHQVAVLLKGAA